MLRAADHSGYIFFILNLFSIYSMFMRHLHFMKILWFYNAPFSAL
jgi:hypothetical protein